MPDNSDLGVGGGSVSGADAEAVRALGDQAKRIAATRQAAIEANARQGLSAATGGGGQVPPSLDEQAAHSILKQLHDQEFEQLDPVANRQQYINSLSKRIVEMEKNAKDTEKTGNVLAGNTFMQVVAILKKRLHMMQSEDAGISPARRTAPQLAQEAAQSGGQ